MSLDELRDGVAVVTGAASGIGLGLATALADEGFDVVLADIDAAAAGQAAATLNTKDRRAIGVACDVSSLESVAELRRTTDRWASRVSVLCNNAGVQIMRHGTYASHEDWRWVLGVNLWGVIHGIETFLPPMLDRGLRAHVVNTASMNGFFPSGNSALYSTGKYAVAGLTESLRLELAGAPVGTTLLCPGAVRSRIFESQRNRPSSLPEPVNAPRHEPSARFDLSEPLEPIDVGRMVTDAIDRDLPYVFTDLVIKDLMDEWHQRRTAAFTGLAPRARWGHDPGVAPTPRTPPPGGSSSGAGPGSRPWR